MITGRSFLHGSHAETQALMSAYVEGEVRGFARWRIMRHLRSCEGCRALYESFMATLSSLRLLGKSEPPAQPDFVDRVIDRIRGSGPRD